MSQTFRKVGTRHPHPDSDFTTDLPEEHDDEVLLDPGSVAVRCMIMRALEMAGVTAADAGADGSVCTVLAPSLSWAELARDEWRFLARDGRIHTDGAHFRRGWDRSWLAWLPEGLPAAAARVQSAEAFASAVSLGVHCVGFATDDGWLPTDMIHTADHRLALATLRAVDVSSVAAQLTGRIPTGSVSEEEACALTPRHLRLAWRQDHDPDRYIGKLRQILDRERQAVTVPAAVSPRDTPDLSRLHGMAEAVAWGEALARDLAAMARGEIEWQHVDRGCLLSGPPGCGKTLYARALAATCGIPLVSGSYSAWLGSGTAHQGDLLKGMARTFADARARAPCILFLDEVDSFPDRSAITHEFAEWERQVVNGLLAEMDGVNGRAGVVMLGACNFPDKLDPALVRSGRLDKHIRIGLPGRAELARILREHLGEDLRGEDLTGAALAASGSTGADCERLVRGARRRARASGRDMLLPDLLDEIGGTDTRTAEDFRTAAIHEAGHVVVAHVLWPGSVGMATLRGTSGGGGFTEASPGGSCLMRESDVDCRLALLMAGRAAEGNECGDPSSGAGGRADSDLAKATLLAAISDSALGLGEDGAGLVWRGMPDSGRLPDILAANPQLAERVRIRLDRAYNGARGLLRTRMTAVRAIAAALMERGVLDGPDAEDIVRRHAGEEGQL